MQSWLSLGMSALLCASVTNSTWTNSFSDGKLPGYFQSKTVIIPKDKNMATGGQDAAESSETMLVIADGVGGYDDLGIDSGNFARSLAVSAMTVSKERPDMNAGDVLDMACKAAKTLQDGGSTAVVIRLHDGEQGVMLESAILGDSGFIVYRMDENGKLAK